MTLSPIQFFIFVILSGTLIMLTMTWLAPSPATSLKEWSTEVPQWFAVTATSVNIGENGKPKHQVSAERLTHYDKQQRTQILKPEALLFNPDTPPWQLNADYGLAKHESALEEMNEMDFWGNVIIWREEKTDLPFSEMTTEYLQFFPEQEYVQTDVLVHFRYGLHTTSALGMNAYLNKQQIKLLDQVQSRYVP